MPTSRNRNRRTRYRRKILDTISSVLTKPLSAYGDNPVLNDAGAAFILGVTTACLKKWRHRKQGPDYLQYGPNGVVRYELKDLMEFRDKHRVKHRN